MAQPCSVAGCLAARREQHTGLCQRGFPRSQRVLLTWVGFPLLPDSSNRTARKFYFIAFAFGVLRLKRSARHRRTICEREDHEQPLLDLQPDSQRAASQRTLGPRLARSRTAT